MNKNSNYKITILFVLSVSFFTAALTTFFLIHYYSHVQFQMLGNFCGEVIERFPEGKQAVLEILKRQQLYTPASANVLSAFGYDPGDFLYADAKIVGIGAVSFVLGSALFVYAFWYWNRKETDRINMLTDFLEKINRGGQGLLWDTLEDKFSGLQDEIYKTVTALFQTRDAALAAKNNYAENLSNIAHQLKTPITAMSLSVQMMDEDSFKGHLAGIKRQLNRLTRLEEALLLLSRIDAGTLPFKRRLTDVFTILTLASDYLEELFSQAGVYIDVPEMGEVPVDVDLDWTMEAVINLMKNCMEAAPVGTTVHCSCENNPLYVQIRIWDEGEGFAKEDFPHLFERFYRGKNAKGAGIGIGLSLAKGIIEMQGGILSAFNLPGGGACFEIRFYRTSNTAMLCEMAY